MFLNRIHILVLVDNNILDALGELLPQRLAALDLFYGQFEHCGEI